MASEFDMNDLNDPGLEDLAVALRDSRPEPEAGFAEELDTAVADHFPAEWRSGVTNRSKQGLLPRLRGRFDGTRRILLPATAAFAGLVLVVAVVGVGLTESGDSGSTVSDSSSISGESSSEARPAEPESSTRGRASATFNEEGTGAGAAADPVTRQANETGPVANSPSPGAYAAGTDDRRVAYETDITLGTGPGEVQNVSNDIVEVVDDHNGIVLDSSVEDGPAGEAGADFSLMFPSAQLESAVSDLSGLADLKARSQESEDITAPTLTIEESLRDSRARVDSLVKELSEATTEEDRARIEDELASERRQAARLNTRLNKLERRANLTPVSVVVETGGDTSPHEDDSAWGVDDALDDAGRMLGIAAGVSLIALAVAIPAGLIVLISLALNRAWVRHSRRRALEGN